MSNDEKIIEYVKNEIIKKFQLPEEKAQDFAEKAVKQIRAHGGNPSAIDETDRVIDVVVKGWIEMHLEQNK